MATPVWVLALSFKMVLWIDMNPLLKSPYQLYSGEYAIFWEREKIPSKTEMSLSIVRALILLARVITRLFLSLVQRYRLPESWGGKVWGCQALKSQGREEKGECWTLESIFMEHYRMLLIPHSKFTVRVSAPLALPLLCYCFWLFFPLFGTGLSLLIQGKLCVRWERARELPYL